MSQVRLSQGSDPHTVRLHTAGGGQSGPVQGIAPHYDLPRLLGSRNVMLWSVRLLRSRRRTVL